MASVLRYIYQYFRTSQAEEDARPIPEAAETSYKFWCKVCIALGALGFLLAALGWTEVISYYFTWIGLAIVGISAIIILCFACFLSFSWMYINRVSGYEPSRPRPGYGATENACNDAEQQRESEDAEQQRESEDAEQQRESEDAEQQRESEDAEQQRESEDAEARSGPSTQSSAHQESSESPEVASTSPGTESNEGASDPSMSVQSEIQSDNFQKPDSDTEPVALKQVGCSTKSTETTSTRSDEQSPKAATEDVA